MQMQKNIIIYFFFSHFLLNVQLFTYFIYFNAVWCCFYINFMKKIGKRNIQNVKSFFFFFFWNNLFFYYFYSFLRWINLEILHFTMFINIYFSLIIFFFFFLFYEFKFSLKIERMSIIDKWRWTETYSNLDEILVCMPVFWTKY